MRDVDWTVVLAGLCVLFGTIALLSTWADPSSVVGHIGRVSWFLAVGALLGAAARFWWEGRR